MAGIDCLQDRTVLVAEPSKHLRQIIINTLRVIGHCGTFIEAPDGSKAIDELKERRVDFAYVNISMDPMDGVGFLRYLRNAKEGETALDPMLPVLLFGNGEIREVVKGMQAGAHGFLALPFTSRAIVGRAVKLFEENLPFVRVADAFGPGKDFFGPVTPWAERDVIKGRPYQPIAREHTTATMVQGDDIDQMFASLGVSQRVEL